jgi:tripartite-type tricarboxylate transporter receptor subunit TctC
VEDCKALSRRDAGAITDTIAGRVDSAINTTGSLLQTVRSGQLRGLAVTTLKRFPTAPELPTIAESGVPGFDVSSWYALFVPAKTPSEIIARLMPRPSRHYPNPR